MSKICFKLCASVFAVFGQSGDDRCGDISVRNLFKCSATFCATISALDLGGIIISSFGASSVSTVVIHPLSFGFSAADDPVGFWVIVGLGSSFGFVVGGSVAEPCSQSGGVSFSFSVGSPAATGGFDSVGASLITIFDTVIKTFEIRKAFFFELAHIRLFQSFGKCRLVFAIEPDVPKEFSKFEGSLSFRLLFRYHRILSIGSLGSKCRSRYRTQRCNH